VVVIAHVPLCGTHCGADAPSTEVTGVVEQVYPAGQPVPHACRQNVAPLDPMRTHSSPVPHCASLVQLEQIGRFAEPVDVTAIE
jgi:hypothetical protein